MPGGICEGGEQLPLALPGYWYSGDAGFRFQMCGEPRPHVKCPGGMRRTCGDHYVGDHCIACNNTPPDVFYEEEGVCRKCPATTRGFIFVIIALVLCFVVELFIITVIVSDNDFIICKCSV